MTERRTTREGGAGHARAGRARPLRADARRNRARVLEEARAVFASEGLSVPIDEIARRAGVGAGTVYRHFPTKEALFEAIILDRIERLIDEAKTLLTAEDPGDAFFGFFIGMVEEAVVNKALVDAIAGAGIDVKAATSSAGRDLEHALGKLLRRAQRAGAVRADVRPPDVKALLVGCLAMESSDARSRRRIVTVVCDGLRSGPS